MYTYFFNAVLLSIVYNRHAKIIDKKVRQMFEMNDQLCDLDVFVLLQGNVATVKGEGGSMLQRSFGR